MVAAGGEEQRLGHPHDDVEAEDADVELVDPIEVGGLHVHVADVDALGERTGRAFHGNDGSGGDVEGIHLRAQQSTTTRRAEPGGPPPPGSVAVQVSRRAAERARC